MSWSKAKRSTVELKGNTLNWWALQGLNLNTANYEFAALPIELKAPGPGGKFCHSGLLIPNQALYYLSYTR